MSNRITFITGNKQGCGKTHVATLLAAVTGKNTFYLDGATVKNSISLISRSGLNENSLLFFDEVILKGENLADVLRIISSETLDIGKEINRPEIIFVVSTSFIQSLSGLPPKIFRLCTVINIDAP